MAKTTKADGIKRQGRRVVPGLRRRTARGAKVSKAAVKTNAPLTLGDLIAAAYDAVGGEVRQVARVLSSADVACAIQRRIVVV